jgi:iron complex outermembrane recepter protein
MPFSLPAKSFLPTTLFLLLTLFVKAQTTPIVIKVYNSKKDAVAYASIKATNRMDSTSSITKVADSTGKVAFNLQPGQYIVSITAVGFMAFEKGITVTDKSQSFSYPLENNSKNLDAVVVVSQKPLMRQEDDKTIIDPENLVASSTSGFEVLEKTPGLFIDQDGNVYISSFTPATVQINGRDLRMGAADVATMLKSFPPSAIVRIEVVRTPSASQDASGSGGVVNVVLKKGFKIGTTGSITAGMQQGTYGNQFVGINVNNNDGLKSSYINVNVARRNNYEIINSNRLIAPDTNLSQAAYTKYPAMAYFTSYGYTKDIRKKWNLDFAGSLTLNDFDNTSEKINKISANNLLSTNINRVTNDGSAFTINNGLAVKKKIDSLGSEWVNDIYYSWSKNNTEQSYFTNYSTPFTGSNGGNGINDNKRGLLTIKTDLKLKLKQKLTLELGAKSSLLNFNSVANFSVTDFGGITTKDVARTNRYQFYENINAAYIQASKTLGKNIVLKTGLRVENTNMKGQQIIPSDTSFNIRRTDLFPYIYLSKNLMKIAGYDLRAYLVYRRSITRPVYEQLNPFPKFIDQYLSEIGNPSLRPQFTQNYEANISVDERPIFALGLNDTKDIFSQVTYPSDTSNAKAFRTTDNLGKNKEWYFRALGALPPGGRYFLVAGAQYNYTIYDGFFNGSPLSFERGTWTFFTYQTLKLDKKSVFTLNGFIRLKGQQQLYEIDKFGMLNASVNRRFLKEKLIVTLSLNDMFFTNKINFSLNQPGITANGLRYNDTRRFGLNIRYNFGVRKKEENNNIFNTDAPVNN